MTISPFWSTFWAEMELDNGGIGAKKIMGPGGDEGEDYRGGSGGYRSSTRALIRHLVYIHFSLFFMS